LSFTNLNSFVQWTRLTSIDGRHITPPASPLFLSPTLFAIAPSCYVYIFFIHWEKVSYALYLRYGNIIQIICTHSILPINGDIQYE